MHARFILIAAATLVSTTAFAADAPSAPVHPAAQPQSAPAPVVLASADEVRAPVTDSQAPAPQKRRVARVTTCRCGGQDATTDPESQPER
jgi:hypothetical protein